MKIRDIIGLIGLLLLLDDAKDIGKFDKAHHWQLGAAMLFDPDWFEELLD